MINKYYSQEIHDPDTGSILRIEYYCTKTCESISTKGISYTGASLYFVKGKKNCEKKCDKLNKYYYDPSSNECLDTCKGLPGKEFAELDSVQSMASFKIYKCISSCPNYYDYDSNICIDKCGSGNSIYLYYSNGGQICYPSCKDILGGG